MYHGIHYFQTIRKVTFSWYILESKVFGISIFLSISDKVFIHIIWIALGGVAVVIFACSIITCRYFVKLNIGNLSPLKWRKHILVTYCIRYFIKGHTIAVLFSPENGSLNLHQGKHH